jgi:hypothetical protein
LRRSTVSSILAPTTLDRASVDHLSLQLNDSQCSVLVSVELDEGEPAIGLHAYFGKIANGLEQRDKVSLRAIRNKVADVDSGVVLRSLLDDGVVRKRAALEINGSRSASATTGARGRSSGSCRCTLRLLVGPVDTDGARSEPLAVHGGDGLLSIGLVPKCEEAITAGLARVHVPHHASVGHGAESAESFGENLIIDFGAEISNENVVVTGGVFLVLLTLVSPVDADLGIEDLAAIESLESRFCSAHIDILHKTIVEAAMLIVAIGNNFNMLNRPCDGKDLAEHVLSDARAQISNVEVGTPLHGIWVPIGHGVVPKKDQDQLGDARREKEERRWTYGSLGGTTHRWHCIHDFGLKKRGESGEKKRRELRDEEIERRGDRETERQRRKRRRERERESREFCTSDCSLITYATPTAE